MCVIAYFNHDELTILIAFLFQSDWIICNDSAPVRRMPNVTIDERIKRDMVWVMAMQENEGVVAVTFVDSRICKGPQTVVQEVDEVVNARAIKVRWWMLFGAGAISQKVSLPFWD